MILASPRFLSSWPMAIGTPLPAQPLDIGALGDVGALHLVAEIDQHLGDAAHADAADADEMHRPDLARQPHADASRRAAAGCALRHPLDQIGQPVDGIRPAHPSRRLGRLRGPLGALDQLGKRLRQPIRVHLALLDHPSAPRPRQHLGIGLLVLIDGVGKRDHDRRPADHGELGNRRGAGTRDDEVARRHAGRQIAEKRLQVGSDAELAIGRRDPVDVLGPALLDDAQPAPQHRRQARNRGRDELGQEARALAAADDEKTKPLGGGPAPDKGYRAASRTAGLTGIAGLAPSWRRRARPARPWQSWWRSRSRAARGSGSPGRARHSASWMTVGTPARARGEHRRHRRIAAEADRRRRPQTR